MITELQKTLLKQAVDLSISTLTTQISKIPNEDDRKEQREIVKHLLNLSDKVDTFEVKKPKKP